MLVYKGKMGCVQLMLLFTCKDDVSCQVAYVHGREKNTRKVCSPTSVTKDKP